MYIHVGIIMSISICTTVSMYTFTYIHVQYAYNASYLAPARWYMCTCSCIQVGRYWPPSPIPTAESVLSEYCATFSSMTDTYILFWLFCMCSTVGQGLPSNHTHIRVFISIALIPSTPSTTSLHILCGWQNSDNYRICLECDLNPCTPEV